MVSLLWAARWSVFHLGAPVLVCFSDGGVSASTPGLIAIKDAHDIETRLNEVEKLLKAIISMPRKVGVRAEGAGRWVGRWGGGHPPGGVEDRAGPGAEDRVRPWALGAPVFSPPGKKRKQGAHSLLESEGDVCEAPAQSWPALFPWSPSCLPWAPSPPSP